MVVLGSVLSTMVHVKLAGVRSTLPASSMARTSKVCEPTVKSANPNGERHSMRSPVWGSVIQTPSKAHSKMTPASLDEKVNVALVLVVVALGPVLIVVSGADTSISQVYSSGEGLAMP